MLKFKMDEKTQEIFDQMQMDIRALLTIVERQDHRISLATDRINILKDDLDTINRVVNTNSAIGNQLAQALEDLEDTVEDDADFNEKRFDGVTEAVNLLAANLGKELQMKPAVPTQITVTPGEPEKLVLVKAKRTKSLPKPKPVTIEVPDGLIHVPGGEYGTF